MGDQYFPHWGASGQVPPGNWVYGEAIAAGDPGAWAELPGGYLPSGHAGYPSSDQNAPDPTYQHGTTQHDADLASGMAQLNTQDFDRSTACTRNPLDKNFVFMNESFFELGRVFACLWSEPAGGDSYGNSQDERITRVFLDGLVYTNIQRFVIIHPRLEQHLSICCPIKTYGRRGTAKFKNLKAHYQHCIIYSEALVPIRLRGEVDYNKEPIHMISEDPSIILGGRSRLNFGKPTPVEHNIRMRNLGRIDPEHFPRLLRYFDDVYYTSYSKTLRAAHIPSQVNVIEEAHGDYKDNGPAERDGDEQRQPETRRDLDHGDPWSQRQVDEAHSRGGGRRDDGEAPPWGQISTTGPSVYRMEPVTDQRRRPSTCRSVQPRVPGAIREHEDGNYEGSGQVEYRQKHRNNPAEGRLDLNAGFRYTGEVEHQGAVTHRSQKYPRETQRNRSDTTKSLPATSQSTQRPTESNRRHVSDSQYHTVYYPKK